MKRALLFAFLLVSCAKHPSYESQREKFVLVQAELMNPSDTIVLGDSITETNVLDGLCGKTFAAGIGGALIDDMQRLAPTLIAKSGARMAVLAIGTNDVIDRKPRFDDRYRKLLDSLPVKPFALVGVHNGDNAFIVSEAHRIGAAYVPPLPTNLTRDGIHPNAQGARWWKARVAAACPRSGKP